MILAVGDVVSDIPHVSSVHSPAMLLADENTTLAPLRIVVAPVKIILLIANELTVSVVVLLF